MTIRSMKAASLAAGLLLALLSACGGDDGNTAASTSSTTSVVTTTTVPEASCPSGFTMPLEVEVDEACLPTFLAAAAEQQGLELTAEADAQAVAICREIGISGLVEATALAFIAWDEGSRPSPADDTPAFTALAVGVYCPEHFDDLRALNG